MNIHDLGQAVVRVIGTGRLDYAYQQSGRDLLFQITGCTSDALTFEASAISAINAMCRGSDLTIEVDAVMEYSYGWAAVSYYDMEIRAHGSAWEFNDE